METVNRNGDAVARYAKYNDYKEQERQQRWAKMLSEFRKERAKQ